jgi:hypothetical protein
MVKFIITLILFSIVGCKKNNQNELDTSNYVEFFYLSPYATFPFKRNCEPIIRETTERNTERDYLKVTDRDYITNFFIYYKKLTPANNGSSEIDGRFQLLVHHNGRTDTICMGTGHGIILNGRLQKDSPKFAKLVTDKIIQNYIPRKKK